MPRALDQIRRMRGGAQSHLMRCADGHYYVVKFQTNPQHRRILVNELLGTRLASRLGLPTAPNSVTNTAVVSGGGETSAANDTASDLTVLDGPSGPADFSIAAAATTATVNKGSQAAYILTLTPLNNIPFATAITLAGSGVPRRGTAFQFQPASVTPGAKPGTSALLLSTSTQDTAIVTNINRRTTPLFAVGFAFGMPLAGLVLAGLRRKNGGLSPGSRGTAICYSY